MSTSNNEWLPLVSWVPFANLLHLGHLSQMLGFEKHAMHGFIFLLLFFLYACEIKKLHEDLAEGICIKTHTGRCQFFIIIIILYFIFLSSVVFHAAVLTVEQFTSKCQGFGPSPIICLIFIFTCVWLTCVLIVVYVFFIQSKPIPTLNLILALAKSE